MDRNVKLLLGLGIGAVGLGLVLSKRGEISSAARVLYLTGGSLSFPAVDTNGNPVGTRPYTSNLSDPQIWNAPVGEITSEPYQRSRSKLDAVIDQFKVTSNPRYRATTGDTYCNIFAQDVVRALGYELPWGRANDLGFWLMTSGAWQPLSSSRAQAWANEGKPALAAWINPDSTRPGHVAVLRPGGLIAQAGATNYNKATLAQGFGSSRLNQVSFYGNA